MRRGPTLFAAAAAAALVAGCTGESDAPGRSANTGSAPAQAASSGSPAATAIGETEPDADFLMQLQQKLTVPPMPSFSIPTDLLATEEDRELAAQLQLEPGLYQGIAVVDVRCDETGEARPVDSGTAEAGAAGAGHFDDGVRTITVGGDGTGVYDAPGLHIAVLAGGAGVYDDATTRLSVQADGAGTFTSGDRRYTVRADGSGSYSDGRSRLWISPDGAGGYDDDDLHVSLSLGGEVFGDGDPAEVASVAAVLREGLPRFPPVPAITRITAVGASCGSAIRLDANVLFDFDAATLRPQAAGILGRVAALLVALGSPAVEVNGHTDQLGDANYNLRLSRERADGVREALIAGGVEPSALTPKGWGETNPLRPEVGSDGADDPAARQLNRRVELVLRD